MDVVSVCLRLLFHGVGARLSMFPSGCTLLCIRQSIPAELKMIVETLALKSRLRLANWAEAKLQASPYQLDTLFMDA
jgi:hypothetical protein